MILTLDIFILSRFLHGRGYLAPVVDLFISSWQQAATLHTRFFVKKLRMTNSPTPVTLSRSPERSEGAGEGSSRLGANGAATGLNEGDAASDSSLKVMRA